MTGTAAAGGRDRRWGWGIAGAALVLAAALPAAARAHLGPPFPIVEDRPAGPYVASIWTDPNIGTGSFFVLLQPAAGRQLPPRTRVRIGVQPLSGRLPEVLYEARAQPAREGQRYDTSVAFDGGGQWRVRVLLDGAQGSAVLTSQVEPTPAGSVGPIGLLIFGFPFGGVAFLWIKAAVRRRGGGGAVAPDQDRGAAAPAEPGGAAAPAVAGPRAGRP